MSGLNFTCLVAPTALVLRQPCDNRPCRGIYAHRVPMRSLAIRVCRSAIGLTEWGCDGVARSEEHQSELQELMRILYAFLCLQKYTVHMHVHDFVIYCQSYT